MNEDRDLLNGLIDESLNELDQADGILLSWQDLDRVAPERDQVDTVFRTLHSIKGGFAYFGLDSIKTLAHAAEDVLARIRDRVAHLGPAMVDILLSVTERLRVLMADPDEANDVYVDDLVKALHGSQATAASIDETFDANGDIQPTIDQVARAQRRLQLIYRIKVAAKTDLVELTARLEGFGEATGFVVAPQAITSLDNVLSNPVSWQCLLLTNVEPSVIAAMAGVPASAIQAVTQLDLQPPASATPPEDRGHDEIAKDETAPVLRQAVDRQRQRALRVDQTVLDEMLQAVTDLVVVGDQLGALSESLSSGQAIDLAHLARGGRDVVQAFDKHVSRVEQLLMQTRMAPIRSVLQGAARTARQVAGQLDKQVQVTLTGDDLCADRAVVDSLGAPLSHIVRNAVDHGVEPPDQRARVGKSERGSITIAASDSDEALLLTITDDGKGLDLDRLREKAREKGVIAANQQLDDRNASQLIFHAGMSTAAKVTDISGRGVGMDVVRSTIRELGGDVEVASQPGQGCTFKLTAPKAAAARIFTGFILRVGHETYILPIDCVLNSMPFCPESVTEVASLGRAVMANGRSYRLVEAAAALEVPVGNHQAGDEAVVVLVRLDQEDIAVVVDELLGIRKVVLRPIEGCAARENLIRGAALLGDGSLALVLDPCELANHRLVC